MTLSDKTPLAELRDLLGGGILAAWRHVRKLLYDKVRERAIGCRDLSVVEIWLNVRSRLGII